MAAKVMSSSTSMYDFQTSKRSDLENKQYRSKSASFSYQNSEEIREKKKHSPSKCWKDALALRDERFSAPSIPSPKISQVKGVLQRFLVLPIADILAKRE